MYFVLVVADVVVTYNIALDKYSVWCTGEHELYDLHEDPYELHNLYDTDLVSIQIVDRLDALLGVLKSCRGHTCRDPWRVLHPDNPKVQTLADALHINVSICTCNELSRSHDLIST